MKTKVIALALACFAAQLLLAQFAPSPIPLSQFVVWQVASPALAQLTPDEQGFVRLKVIGHQFTSEHKYEPAQRVVDAVQQLGYFRARESGSEFVTVEPSHPELVELRLSLQLGPRFRFAHLNWKGVTALAPGQLALLTPMKAGDVFDTERVRLLLGAVRRIYGALGNNQVTIVPVTDVDDSARTVAVTMDVSEHSQ